MLLEHQLLREWMAPSDSVEVSPFSIGERLFYTNEGHTAMVTLREIKLNKNNAATFTIELPSKKHLSTTADYLCCPFQPDIASIPINPEDFERHSTNLDSEQLHNLSHPIHLSPEQQELISWHHRLSHTPFTSLMRMANIGLIPKYLAKLRNFCPQCPSCIFGHSHQRSWQ